jgi:hypothetical protein
MELEPQPTAQADRTALLGAAIAGGGGILLFLSLFLIWFEFPGSQVGGEIGDVIGLDVRGAFERTGWEAFEVIDMICAAAAILAVSRAAVAILGSEDNPSVPGAVLTGGLGALALAGVVYRVLDPPGIGFNRELGVWVGLFAAAAIVYGCYVALRAERGDVGIGLPR